MRTVYGALMRLYPARYRDAFAQEMTVVFERARRDAEASGSVQGLFFALRELGGLVKGLCVERMARLAAQDGYLNQHCIATGSMDEITQTRVEIEKSIRAMEHAIAHHHFAEARLYSDQERAARTKLNQLISRQEISEARRVRQLCSN